MSIDLKKMRDDAIEKYNQARKEADDIINNDEYKKISSNVGL